MRPGTFYIVGCSNEPDGGIYSYDTDAVDGFQRSGFVPAEGANYLAASVNGAILYASCNRRDGSGFVSAFRIADDGRLSLLNVMDSGGKSCCHLCVSPDGLRLYAANYSDGSFSEFELEPDGRLTRLARVIRHYGHGVDPKRQEGPHAHFTGFSPDGGFLIVNDLGLDTVFSYPYGSRSGVIVQDVIENKIVPPGSGPRHLLFEPEGGSAVLITEMGNCLQRLAFNCGVFTRTDSVATLPERVDAVSKASAVRFSPDGKFVFATNRGFDSIAVFERSTLKRCFLTLSGGSSPRDFNFLPDGRAAAANEFSGKVVFFNFRADDGALIPDGRELTLPRPLCIFPGCVKSTFA